MTRRVAISLCIFASSLLVMIAVLVLSLERSGATGAEQAPARHQQPHHPSPSGPHHPSPSGSPPRPATRPGTASRGREAARMPLRVQVPLRAQRAAEVPGPDAGKRRLQAMPAVDNPFDGAAGAL